MPAGPATLARRATLVVLAGGGSRRLGRDKMALPFGESTVLGQTLRQLSPHFARTIVAGRRAIPPEGVRAAAVEDDQPEQGPLAGVIAGLEAAETELAVVVGGDYVLLPLQIPEALLTALGRAQVVVPRCGGRLQHLVAAVRREVLPVLREAFAEGVRRPIVAFRRTRCDVVVVPPRYEAQGAFVGVNTWAQYEALLARAAAAVSG